MQINDLESHIAFQMKPVIESQQKLISAIKSTALEHTTDAFTKKNEIPSINPKHSRTISLNFNKSPNNATISENRGKIAFCQNKEISKNSIQNEKKMENLLKLLKNAVCNLNNDIASCYFQNTQKREKEFFQNDSDKKKISKKKNNVKKKL